jgi:hypothetical protein
MVETLRAVSEILWKQDHPGQAEVVDRLIQLHENDRVEFRRLLQSIDMWGGSGAVWEVAPLGDDDRRFCQLIVRLAEEMEAARLGTDRSRDIAGIFRYWLAQGIV